MQAHLSQPADGGLSGLNVPGYSAVSVPAGQAGPEHGAVPPRRRGGNFVTGCLIGGAIATVLWAAIGFAAFNLL